jgi:phosphoenolpyruvate phosphomutase
MSQAALKKTTKLKNMLTRTELGFLMEAHNGLSAKVVEEAGFEGIWGSGLSISAALGVRDNNEASWTQVLEVVEFMSDATTIPILLDGDTGYGNFNSMRRLVQKLEQRQVAGVCIEDKIFPKTNSFIRGTSQPLADIQEFAGKIKAGKDAQRDDDFVIVARVEAFIAGWGLDEALKRAEAYRLAGADAILMHSALKSPNEILAFKKEWGDRLPVVIVPTKYYGTPTDVFRDHGIRVVIWANHLMRSALTAMKETAATIKRDENLLAVEDKVVTVAEVFRIQGENELAEAETRYLPKTAGHTTAVVLAASRGVELGALTEDRPKAMVKLGHAPILAHIADTYRAVGIKDIVAVRGFKKEAVNLTSMRFVDNDDYAKTQEVSSLSKALPEVASAMCVSYGDVLFKKFILGALMESDADVAIAIDSDFRESRNRGRLADYVLCSEPSSRTSFLHHVTVKGFASDPEREGVHGEWMGVLYASERGALAIKSLVKKLEAEDPARLARMKMPDLLGELVAGGTEIRAFYFTGNWLDIDHVDDLVIGANF